MNTNFCDNRYEPDDQQQIREKIEMEQQIQMLSERERRKWMLVWICSLTLSLTELRRMTKGLENMNTDLVG